MSLKLTERPTKLQQQKNILAMEPQEQKSIRTSRYYSSVQKSFSKFHKKITEKKISSETKKNPCSYVCLTNIRAWILFSFTAEFWEGFN